MRTWATSMAWPSPSMMGWSSSAWMSRDVDISVPPLDRKATPGYRRARAPVIGQLSWTDITFRHHSAVAGPAHVGGIAVDQLVLVSSDCHGGAPWEGYKPYLSSELHEQFDAWLETKYASEEESKRW